MGFDSIFHRSIKINVFYMDMPYRMYLIIQYYNEVRVDIF